MYSKGCTIKNVQLMHSGGCTVKNMKCSIIYHRYYYMQVCWHVLDSGEYKQQYGGDLCYSAHLRVPARRGSRA